MNRLQTCCFTGHRNLTGAGPELNQRLEMAIRREIENGVRFFGAGGGMGFDTLAARTVLRLKEEYPEIRLILVLPCRNQTEAWPPEAVEEYESIRRRADKVVWLADRYYRGCMQVRNRYLVDHSGVCICYQKQEQGGTTYTVDYCTRSGVKTVNLAEDFEQTQLPHR